jgi:preprotein translocase subunit SecA
MTGTADTEAFEFKQIYGLDVLVIPTHKPMVRDDQNDLIYATLGEKYLAIVEDIEARVANGQPVLVGTASIESSEILSKELEKGGVKHSILNAKQHEREADIIADAGRPGVVTIATNMAGRGTDIVLGGNLEAELNRNEELSDTEREELAKSWESRQKDVLESGGLHIIGTERHESRRIDNQLRGRSGRQGDAGSSRFYLSMEDNLLRLFGSGKIRDMMASNLDGQGMEAGLLSRSIENAQRKVEGHNFDARKNLLDYDDVANDQRQVIYRQRMELMSSTDISETIGGMREEVLYELFYGFIPPETVEEQWDVEGLEQAIYSEFGQKVTVGKWLREDDRLDAGSLPERILVELVARYQSKESSWKDNGIDMRLVEKQIMLQLLDQRWKEHLATMDQLRQGIHLRAYAQKQPKQEYKRESFELFQDLLRNIKSDVVGTLSKMQIESSDQLEESEKRLRQLADRDLNYARSE